MKQVSTRHTTALYKLSLAFSLIAAVSISVAQEAVVKAPSSDARAEEQRSPIDPTATQTTSIDQTAGGMPQAEYEQEPEPLQIGDATQGLLAWQRSGELAAATPRPIEGSVANRSYERYLKSFEFPIPEHMSSTVKSASGTGNSK